MMRPQNKCVDLLTPALYFRKGHATAAEQEAGSGPAGGALRAAAVRRGPGQPES